MNYQTGVVEDPRPKKEKKKDWNADELLAGAPVIRWEEKKKWKKYTERNQKSTYTCVAQTVSKLLEVNEKKETGQTVVFSASKPYAERTNTGAGSWLQEMLKYAVDPAYYTTEKEMVSQFLSSDAEMEKIAKEWNGNCAKIAKKYAGKSYLTVNTDIDSIAYWVSRGYGVSILIYATYKEWSLKYPKIKDNVSLVNAPIRHAIAVVDYGLRNGKKYLKIEDSAHFGGRSERWINEEFVNKRCYGAGFVFDKPNEEIELIPYFEFKTNLFYGMRNNPDVVELQKKLKVLGFFPEAIPCTGNFLEITRQAVEKYQRFYKVASEWELNVVRGKIVGIKTRNKLNE